MTAGKRFSSMAGAAGLALGALAGSLSGSISDARAQSQDERFTSPRPPGLIPGGAGPFGLFGVAPAPAGPPGKDDWSGESGSSGHPLMQADAIRAAAANFPKCIAGFWPDAARRGVTRATFDTYTAGLTPDLKIMDFVDSQPEFTKAFWDYLDMLVSEARIKRGREILAANKATFDAVEQAYGVDRHIVAAIWGIEFELLDRDRRAAGAALDRDARLRRAPPGLLQGRVPRHARDPQPRRRRRRTGSRARGRAPSVRPSSCRPRSSATPSISTATGGATWSTRFPIWSPRPPTTSSSTAGRRVETWGYEVVVPQRTSIICSPTARIR